MVGSEQFVLQNPDLQHQKNPVHFPNIKFMGSNKDPPEINSLCKQLPKVKCQLCYWHAIKYIKEWLGENQPPAAYNAPCAHNAFSFIDPTWVPGVTRNDIDEHLDGCDIEKGADLQGGTLYSIENCHGMSEF